MSTDVAKPEGIFGTIEGVFKKGEKDAVSLMDWIGSKGVVLLTEVEEYLPDAAAIAKLLFPGAAAETTVAVNIITLTQQLVVLAKQKWDAQDHTGESTAQMLADELAILESIVPSYLASVGITWDTSKVQALITLVVQALNLTTVPVPSGTSTPSPAPAPTIA